VQGRIHWAAGAWVPVSEKQGFAAVEYQSINRSQVIGEKLASGARLLTNQALASPSGKYRLIQQEDGNLVLYNLDPAARDKGLWSSGTYTSCKGSVTIMQPDGNLVIYRAGVPVPNPNGQGACWASGTNNHAGAALWLQNDGNLVIYAGDSKPNATGRGALWSSRTMGGHRPPSGHGFFGSIAHAFSSAASTIGHGFNDAIKAVEKIPVVGPAITAAVNVTPLGLAQQIASGARLDHAVLNSFKNQLAGYKALAPYASTVVSFVPGIGTGVAAAIGAATALAEGQSITDAAMAAVKNAIPGGALVQAGFQTAVDLVKGKPLVQSVLDGARSALPPEAQKAFDIGVAIAHGRNIQDALVKGVTSLAPAELQGLLSTGAKALQATPGLAQALTHITDPVAKQGFQLAAGVLGHSGVNENVVSAMRDKLAGPVREGFDAALKAQQQHFPWLAKIPQAAQAQQVAQQVAQQAVQQAVQRVAPRVVSPPRLVQQVAQQAAQRVAPKVMSPADRAQLAFASANAMLEHAATSPMGKAALARNVANLTKQAAAGHAPAQKALHVVNVVQQWRNGLHQAQQQTAQHAAAHGVVGGLDLEPAPIPDPTRLSAAGVPPGSF
jgi:hypothetical protein